MEHSIVQPANTTIPWYKDADATRIAVGVGYLVVLVSIMVFVMLTWRAVPDVAITPAGVAAVGKVADTSTSIASVSAPTGTPSGSGTHYVTNSNGEVFMYNAATGTWVLIANGYHMIEVAAGDVIEVFFWQNNVTGAKANLRMYNTQLHYLT